MLTKLIEKSIIFRRWEGDKQIDYFRRSLFSNAQIGETVSISDCTTGQYEVYGIYNKNALFAWKYQVSLHPVF